MQRIILKLFDAPADRVLPREVRQLAEKFGVEFRTMHPGAEEQVMASYFFADVDANDPGEELLDELRRCECVDGAYLKSDGEPPADTI